jgi:hypothetical protein
VTRDELMAAAAQVTYRHALAVADTVPVDLADSHPHADGSDYLVHHHLVSAPSHVDDRLNAELMALIRTYQRGLGGPR